MGFVVGKTEDGDPVLLGGNQGDEVRIEPYSNEKVLGYYWPTDRQDGQPTAEMYELPVFFSKEVLTADLQLLPAPDAREEVKLLSPSADDEIIENDRDGLCAHRVVRKDEQCPSLAERRELVMLDDRPDQTDLAGGIGHEANFAMA